MNLLKIQHNNMLNSRTANSTRSKRKGGFIMGIMKNINQAEVLKLKD